MYSRTRCISSCAHQERCVGISASEPVQLPVGLPEVLSPLGDAVRLVHSHQAHPLGGEQVQQEAWRRVGKLGSGVHDPAKGRCNPGVMI